MNMKKQQGSSTVEFAIMLPLLILLVVMVAEFGIMFYRLNAVNKSVQIAARYLSDVSVNYSNNSADKANAKNLAVYGNVAGTGSPIVPNLSLADIAISNVGAQHVRVVASYNANLVLGNALSTLMGLASGGSAPTSAMALQASSVMRFAQ
ncbi:MAG: TadE/TadG family type IV pilus assembly protein [Methylobacter sp.]